MNRYKKVAGTYFEILANYLNTNRDLMEPVSPDSILDAPISTFLTQSENMQHQDMELFFLLFFQNRLFWILPRRKDLKRDGLYFKKERICLPM